MSETSYNSDSNYAVFLWSRRMFYIPRTCPHSYQKFSSGLKKVSGQNMRIFQNIPISFWPVFFENLIGLSCVCDFLLEQRARLGKPFRYIEHVRKVHRKVFRAFEKSFNSKNEVLFDYMYSNFILTFISSSFCELKRVFKGL